MTPSIPPSMIASGLRTATGVVVIGDAAAPTAGQVPTATGPTAANWQTPGGGSGLLQQVTVSLTSAQIKAMSVTPVLVVPAPGAGLKTVVSSCFSELVYGTTTYTGGGVTLLYYGPTNTNAATQTSMGGCITSTVSTSSSTTAGLGVLCPNTTANNAPLYIISTIPFAIGDGTLNLIVTYYTAPIH